jgi:ATP-dependent Clp protease ATP-binding subunit ClpA
MWEPFTERSRRAIVLAQEEAQRLGNNFMGTEHILLGIISEGEGLAAKVLETLGVDLAKVRAEVVAIVGRGAQTAQQEMIFTPRAKRVIELAFEEARQLNHNYIGTEHLLLGMIREGEGVGARVLTNLGVDSSKVRAQVASLRDKDPQTEPSPTPPVATFVQSPGQQVGFPDSALTPAARHALISATEAAQRYGSPVCDVPHLLYGIVHVETTKASRLLGELGVTADAIAQRLSKAQSGGIIDQDEVALSAAARTNIANAVGEAHQSGRRKANVEHLLLAIASGDENDGTRLLQTLGVDLGDLARALEHYLKGNA